jgi:hypothetical protein
MIEANDTDGEAARAEGPDRDGFAEFWDCAVRAGTGAAEVGSHVATLLAVRRDRARAAARRVIALACLAFVALIGAGVAVAAASWRIVAGACELATSLFDGRAGAGDLAGSAAVLVALSLAVATGWKLHEHARFREREAEYAHRRGEHARRVGGHAGERADDGRQAPAQ